MFKIKSQHQHQDFDCHPRRQIENQFQSVDIIPLQEQKVQPKKRRIRINSIPGEDVNQYILVDALIPQLEQSIQLITDSQFEEISIKRKNLQKFVYISTVEDGKYYLAELFQANKIKYSNQLISETVADINDTIVGEILEGQHDVHKIARPTKEEIFNGGTRVTGAAIKIRQQMIKAKLSDLKADINISNLNISETNPSSFLNLNSADLYSQNSYRTKQAKQFVKRMQQLQQTQKRQKQLKEEFKRQKKLQEQAQKKQMEERIKLQKHQYLKRQFEQKKQAKQQQRRDKQAKSLQFKKFLEQFKSKVPLFIQKQKQFHQKVQIPQNKKKFNILKQIKQQRGPMDHEQLKQHERNYLQIKQDHVYEKNAARALQSKARSKRPDMQLPKSKFHAIIQKQQIQKKEAVDELQIKTKMYQKRIDYAKEIKTKFAPKIDLKKRQELIKKSEELNWIEKVRINRSLHMDTYKKDGKDNLDRLHKQIAELKAKGKILTSTSRTIQSSPQTNSARYKNYLHELRQLQTSSNIRPSRAHSIDYTTLLQNRQQAQKIKINLKMKQESTLRRQQYVASLGSRNLQKYMQQKKRLDDDYLDTVKAKMAIINKFQ